MRGLSLLSSAQYYALHDRGTWRRIVKKLPASFVRTAIHSVQRYASRATSHARQEVLGWLAGFALFASGRLASIDRPK